MLALFNHPLVMHDGSVVAHAFDGHEVAVADVGGVEADGGMAVGIGLDFGVPVERGALVGTRLL